MTGFDWVLLGLIGFYWVLLGLTGFDWVWLGLTGVYWVLLGFEVDLCGFPVRPNEEPQRGPDVDCS